MKMLASVDLRPFPFRSPSFIFSNNIRPTGFSFRLWSSVVLPAPLVGLALLAYRLHARCGIRLVFISVGSYHPRPLTVSFVMSLDIPSQSPDRVLLSTRPKQTIQYLKMRTMSDSLYRTPTSVTPVSSEAPSPITSTTSSPDTPETTVTTPTATTLA